MLHTNTIIGVKPAQEDSPAPHRKKDRLVCGSYMNMPQVTVLAANAAAWYSTTMQSIQAPDIHGAAALCQSLGEGGRRGS